MGDGPDSMLPYLGAAARDARKSRGRHQGHIAAEIGVDQGTIRRFEQGKHWPRDPDAMIAAYARDLEIDPRDLWEEATRRWRKAT
jgi:transcriptional regulator with XRE-family HTH domain